MANPNFTPTMSSNEVWFGTDSSVCLTDVVEGKAEADHSHSEYAAASHSHTGYAAEGHTHDGYAAADHVHTGYAEAGHTHSEYASATALSSKADVAHTHSEYAAASHAHTGYAAVVHTHDGYASESHTHSEYAASSHSHSQNDVTGLSDALSGKANSNHIHTQTDISGLSAVLEGKADADHTHGGYAASGHTHTPASIGAAAASHTHANNVIVEQVSSPYVRLKLADATPEARVYKNASTTADYGLTLADYDTDGAKDSLIFCRNNALDKKLYMNVQNDDDTRSLYYLYGEHHKPTLDEIGGGTINGDVNVNGVLRVNGQQSFYFQTSTNSQTVGTNNATGGTTICCGSSADVNVNGANTKVPNVLPRSNNAFNLGSASVRWKGIYSAAAVNVSSDKRLKRDIDYFFEPDLLKFINGLCVASYNYNDDPADSKKRMGLIAQEVIAANPALAEYFVDVDESGFYNLRPADFVFPLIAAVQALTAEVNRLKERLDEK